MNRTAAGHHEQEEVAQPDPEPVREAGEVALRGAARQLRHHRRHDRDREQPVRHLEERVRVEIRRHVAGGAALREHEHEQQRDLVGDDVADRPPRQPQHLADRGMAPVEGRRAGGCARCATREGARAPSPRCPAVVPAPSSVSLPGVAADPANVDPLRAGAGGAVRERDEHADHEHVVEHGRERGRDEPPVRVEQRGRERGEARRTASGAGTTA